ncbi:MAG: thiamine diphosphokinase [Omnitrophica WOR_2 bacterium]
MRAVIVANGEINISPQSTIIKGPEDVLIAADGGANSCRLLGLVPDVVIGDFDSLDRDQLAGFEAAGTKIIKFPVHKDFTDLELAVQYARDQGIKDIVIFGALGARWDQTLANLLLPASPGFVSTQIRIMDGSQEIQLLRAGESLILAGAPGDIVSLIPIAGNAGGITTQGLEYPLSDEPLLFGATRGISNSLLQDKASVHLKSGMLLCILSHQ